MTLSSSISNRGSKTDVDAVATTTDTNVTAAATLRYLLVQNSLDA